MDKLNKLIEIASGSSQPQTSMYSMFEKNTSKTNLTKATKDFAFSSSKDPYEAFDMWFERTQKFVDTNNRNEYWSFAEKNFPGSKEQAKEYLMGKINSESGDTYIEESNLRNKMTKIPDWAINEIKPRLAFLQANNANQNLMKATNLYRNNFKQKIQGLLSQPLDIDVPVEEHVRDITKLEAMNMLDVARVENGRFIVADQKGNIIPAFDLRDRPLGNDPSAPLDSEIGIVYQVVPEIAKEFVEFNVSQAKKNIEMGNKMATAAALRMLNTGDLPIEEWGNAFSVMSNVDSKAAMKAAIEGHSKKNPYSNIVDPVAVAVKISDAYSHMNKDTNVTNTTAKPTS